MNFLKVLTGDKKSPKSNDSTIDTSHFTSRKQKTVERKRSVRITPRPLLHTNQQVKTNVQNQQISLDNQLLQILLMSDQISKNKPLNDLRQLKNSKREHQQNSVLFLKFHKLFDLYIKEQILKHYCMKSGWKIQKKILDRIVIPTFDILAISKDKLPFMFEPFLKELTCKYILKTQIDTFSRFSAGCLLIQITEIWLRIKQAEIDLKRQIRGDYEYFKKHFCKNQDGKLLLDRNFMFQQLFKNSHQLCMVNLIKVYIFCYKAQGQFNEESLQNWIQNY